MTDFLQVKEQGQTKVLLDSNLIEVHELKKAYEKTGPSYPGRGRGRGRGRDALTRFIHREDRLMGGGQPILPSQPQPEPRNDFGDGWFIWRAWRVNQPFMDNFNKHIERLVDKHKAAIEREQSRVDNRIAALVKEKEVNRDPGLQRIIDFFAEVFVKYLYVKTKFAALKVEQIIDILRQFYSLENTEFASQIRIVMQQQQTFLQHQPQPPEGSIHVMAVLHLDGIQLRRRKLQTGGIHVTGKTQRKMELRIGQQKSVSSGMKIFVQIPII